MDEETAIGVKDMHSAQIQELMNFCCYVLDLANEYGESIGDPEVLNEASSHVESLAEMFGANVLILQTSPESSGSEQGLSLLERLLRDSGPEESGSKPE
jgi:hypothetical protein